MNTHSQLISGCSLVLALFLAALTPSPALAAGYLKIADIKGESTDRAHKGEIEILSWSWGETGLEAGSGLTTGKRQHKPLTITKRVDKTSPVLQRAQADGRVFPEMTVYLPQADPGHQTYLKYKLSNVHITSFQTSAASSDSVPTETFTLNFEIIKVYDKPSTATAVIERQ